MNKLKSLQIKKLMKELDYIETDFEWRTEVVSGADTSFLNELNVFLDKNPELKELYNNKVDQILEKSIKSKIEKNEKNSKDNSVDEGSEEDNEEDLSKKKINISLKVKKLYRDIVKKTHPDIIDNKELNDLYITATGYHELNDKISIYKVCNELDIKFEIDDEDSDFIEKKILEYKKRINFLESTFTWKWFNTEGDSEKDNIILTFIKLKIS